MTGATNTPPHHQPDDDQTAAAAAAATDFPLAMFRMLAKADEEQSIFNDFAPLWHKPDPLGIAVIMVVSLSLTRSIASKSRHRRQQTFPFRFTMSLLMVAFAAFYQVGFDIGIKPLPVFSRLGGSHSNDTATTETESDDASRNPSTSIYRPYTNYTNFYAEAYTDAHLEPASRTSHFFLGCAVCLVWMYESRLFVASAAALLLGAIATFPLALCDMEWIEMMLVLFVGLAISRICYATMRQWLVFFLVWTSLDYLDHHYLGIGKQWICGCGLCI